MNQNLKLRIITAVIGVPIILLCLIGLGIEGVAFFSWIISMGMLYEFCQMFFKLEDAKRKTFIALMVGTFVHAFNYVFNSQMSASLLGLAPVYGFFLLFLFMVPSLFNYQSKEALSTEAGIDRLNTHLHELMALCFGMVYCVWFPLLLVSIREINNGKHWVIFCLLIVWSSDTFAYFAGKFFGKHRLYETISPKKTWEGAIGGSLGAVLVAGVYAHFFIPHPSLEVILVIILTVSGASILGDLCESLIKRACRVKDSGTILPGHGGFLDRFDGVLFALPTLYALLWIFL